MKVLRESDTRVRTADGRVFDLIGQEPYIRKDGTETSLVVWESLCQACADPFTVRTPSGLADATTSKAFGMHHCPAHRLSQSEVVARWQSAIKASRDASDLKRFPAHPTGAKSLLRKAENRARGGRTDAIGERIGGAR